MAAIGDETLRGSGKPGPSVARAITQECQAKSPRAIGRFREVLALEPYPQLRAFAQRFGTRSSARATAFKFDFPPA